jgi:peptide/nickel transport system substrate-binding protein
MMPARVAATDPNEKITDTTGSGPFIFAKDEYRAGSKVVYLKNPNYVPRSEPSSFLAGGKRALVDRVEWLYIPDNNTALAALQSGEADWWELPPNDLLPVLEKDPNIAVENGDLLGSQGILRPNWLQPPFDNVKARQALLYLVDQKEILQAAIGDQKLWRLCASYFTCGGAFESNAGVADLGAPNLDKAKALLAEGGYKGEPIVILDPTDEAIIHATALVTAQNLRKIGAKVDVQAMDWSTLVSRRGNKGGTDKGGWNIFITYTGGDDSATPLTNTAMVSTCDKAWFGWACDEEIEKLRSAWALESDPAKQKALADQIQTRALAVIPYVSYGQFFTPTAFRKAVTGRIPSSDTVFWNVDVKE